MVWAVFGQTLGFEFVNYDDNFNVYENPDITGGLSLQALARAFTRSQVGHWDPLTTISHVLDCQVYGLQPWGHHLTNVLLHGMTAILLFLVLRQMTGALWRSAFVAAVFAIHPLRAESVAWISERKDVLSGVFFMLIIAAYVRYTRRPSSWARYLAVLLLFAVGLMCKSMLVTVPFVLLLLDYWPLNRFQQPPPAGESVEGSVHGNSFLFFWRLILEKIPFFILSAALCIVQLFADSKGIISIEYLPLSWRVGNAIVSYAAYIGQMFLPVKLAGLYPKPNNKRTALEIDPAFLLLTGISAGVFALRRKYPYLLAGWLWYLGMLVPVIGIVQSGIISRADRYTYLPEIGLYLMITWTAADLSAKWNCRRVILGTAATLVIATLLWRACIQVTYWRNTQSLWENTIACTTLNYAAENSLGNVFAAQGKIDEAILHFERSIADKPDYAPAHLNLSLMLMKQGHYKEAMSHLQTAGQIAPQTMKVINNLAWMLATSPDESLRNGPKAVELALQANYLTEDKDPMVLDTLAAAYAEAARFPDAVKTAQRALALAETQGNKTLAANLRNELALYLAGKPFRDTGK